MSPDLTCLALRLEGPLQSWGFDSQYNRRNTGLMPTKSAVAGMCCAALGFSRGSDDEREFLKAFTNIKMTTIAIPRRGTTGKGLPVRRLQDYHTVLDTRKASGGIKDCQPTHRQYLLDASFGILLEGSRELLRMITDEERYSLLNPKWGLWLGRKSCIPTAPVLAGLGSDRDEALRLLIGDEPLSAFTRQIEVGSFGEGQDSLPDSAISFSSEGRLFSPRRVSTELAK